MIVSAPLNIVVVGAGSMGSLHARVVAQSESCRLAALVDPRAEVGRALADRFSTQWQPELGSLAGVDGVVVAAATEAHEGLARHVLEAGVPLLVEKPVTADYGVSCEIVALSEKHDVPMMCGLLERYNPAVVTARPMIDSPVHVRGQRHSPYAPRIKTGVAWDLLVHDVDLAMQFLPGDVDHIGAVVGQFHPSSVPGAEDVVETTLRFDSGAVASISASRIGQRKVRTLVVHDIDKLVEIDLLRRDITVYHHVSEQAATEEGRGYRQQTIIEIPELVTSREPLAAQLDHFVELVRGTADAASERASILPSHEVVERVKQASLTRA